MNTNQFETEHFRFIGDELHLLRSRYPYQKINFRDISKISIMKGIRVKRPLLVFVFGLILISVSLYVILITSGFLEVILTTNFEGDSFSAYKTFSYFLLMGGFLIAIGGVAIFQATYPIWIMRTEFTDGTHHVFGLQKLFEVNEVFTFIRFLRKNFTLTKLEIDDRIA